MNAVTKSAADIGQVRDTILHMHWSFGQGAFGSTPLRISYQIDYPSVWHRGRGIDAQVRVHAITREIKNEWVPAQLNAAQEEAIRRTLEEDEILNAPLADC